MQRVKMLGLALGVVLALGAAVTAVASAEVSFLPEGTAAEPVEFTMSSGTEKWQALNTSLPPIICETDSGTGEVTSKTSGHFHIKFEKCETEVGGVKQRCADLKQPEHNGIVEVLGEFHLRMGLTGQPLGIVAFLIESVHFLCSIALFVLLGCFAGSITPLEELKSELEVSVKQTAGENEILSIDNEPETAMEECTLLLKKGTGTEETAGEETLEKLKGFKKGTTSVTALVHA